MIITKITTEEIAYQVQNGHWKKNENGLIEQARQFIDEIGIARLDNLRETDPRSSELGTLDFSESLVVSVAGLLNIIYK